MAIDFSKFDKSVDLEGLKHDVEEAQTNDGGTFKEVPHGKYEIEVTKLELTVSKSSKQPMVSCWMKILEGEYEGSLIFMNQVITQGFQVHLANRFLRSLVTDMDINVEFVSYTQYAELLLDIAEAINGKREYLVDYYDSKGYNAFNIEEVYDVD